MNTPCPTHAEHIDLAAAGWLNEAELAALHAHAAACPACREALAAAHQLANDLTAAHAVEPAIAFPPAPPAPARRGWLVALAAAAAALVAAVALPRRTEPVPAAAPALSAAAPTWFSCNRLLAEPDGLESLLDRHASGLRLGQPEPVLMARLSCFNPEELP